MDILEQKIKIYLKKLLFYREKLLQKQNTIYNSQHTQRAMQAWKLETKKQIYFYGYIEAGFLCQLGIDARNGVMIYDK